MMIINLKNSFSRFLLAYALLITLSVMYHDFLAGLLLGALLVSITYIVKIIKEYKSGNR